MRGIGGEMNIVSFSASALKGQAQSTFVHNT